jgi:hypothetical protein
MTYIRKLYDRWLDFKHLRHIKPMCSGKETHWMTMKQREKMIDALFDYINYHTKPKEKK